MVSLRSCEPNPQVTSTGKAGGAGVRAGCAVKAINGTPTAQLTLSHAHALTKQGSTLTLEIDDSSEEPFGTSIRSTSTNSSTSASTSSTVVAANGHISSAKRKGDSGSCSERPTEVRTEDSTSHTEKSEDSETSVIFLETHGADPNILRSDPEQGAAGHDVTDTEASPPKAESDSSTQESKDTERRFSRDSTETDEGDYAEIGSQTDTSTDTLVFDVSQNDLDATYTEESSRGASVEFDQATGAYIEYPNEASDDESLKRSQSEEDYSSLGENDSFFVNFEEELEKVEQQYPELEAKHLLSEGGQEQEAEEGVVWVCEVVEGSSTCFTIAEEVEEEENPVPQVGKLDSTMGQYYSSASGGDPSRGDASGSLPSSPRSSEGWRMSMASTATVASSATANSDDTLAKDMSELSSINSRLSYLDEAHDDGKVPSLNQNTDPDIIPKETLQPDQARQTSIKDAIDELESIEQAAQTLLLKRQCSDDERATPVPGDACMAVDSTQKVYENSNKSERHVGADKTESSFSPENVHKNDRYTNEEKVSVIISEDKPPLPPTAGSQPPKVEVKRRWFSRSKEIQPYISRESYNNDKIFKELERLRRSFQESDLNDFLDTLENTAIPDDMDEAFLRQLLLDIREDVEGPPPLAEGDAQLIEDAEIIESEAATPVPDVEAVAEVAPRQTATGSKFEKVKERILEMIKVRKKDKGKDGDDADTLNLQKDDSLSNELLKDDSSRSETPQISRSITPQSLRPETPDSKSSRPLTPDSSKGDESKKGFNIAEFLKKGSPKYLRKKYKERKNRKSDVLTTSESESEDAEGLRKDVNYSNNSSSTKKTILSDSQSSLKGSNRSLTASQELKKEVRFDLNTDTQKKGGDDSKNAKIEPVKPVIEDEKTKDSPRLSGPQMITCEAQQQETVILKEFEETTQEMENDYILNLPSTVEDINARAENLLPRLPERAKPPRRRKKLIPAPVEELSTDVQSETTSTTSVESVKETRAESLKVNAALKDESPPPLPPYDEVTELETCTPTYIQVVETSRHPEDIAEIVEEITESIEITERRVKAPPLPAVTTSGSPATVINEIIILNSEASSSVASTTDSRNSDGLVDPIPVTSVATISVAPAPETAVVVMYPPRTLPLPVIQESLNEDQVSLPTPSEPTLSFSTLTSSATTPLEGDHNESFYDNANPFEEFIEEEKTLSLQPDTAEATVESELPAKPTIVETENKVEISETLELTNKDSTNLEKTDLQKDSVDSQIIEVTPQISETHVGKVTTEIIPCESFEEVAPGEVKVDDEKVFEAKPEAEPEAKAEEKPEAESETKSEVKAEAKPDTKAEDKPETKTEETERLITESSVIEETIDSKSETTYEATETAEDTKDKLVTDSQQEACKSPELEKKEIADIDTLAALTAEMFRFANEDESSKTRKQDKAFESAVTSDRSDDTSDMATQKDAAVSETPKAQTQDMSTSTDTKEMVTQTEQDASPRAKSVKEMVKSNTIAIQTDATRLVRMYEAASQTDTEYETDLETESELEENASGRYDASKWLFRPTNDAKTMDPQMQELHKQQQMMIQELQQQSVMQQQKQKKAPEVPPRQFQQKMPMQVVEELKSVLAENGDETTRLKKVADPPPRWDSDVTWENALQELGLDESTLLNEIEQILGFGSLSSKSRTESQNELTSPRPDPVARGHKLGKSRSEEAPLVPGRESSKGVWSPGRTDEKDSSGPSKIDVPDLPSFKDQPTVWSPSRGKTPPARSPYTRPDYAGYPPGSASPSLGRKEYRKITYEGTLQKRPSQENVSAPRPEESFAWKDKEIERTLKSPTSTLPKVQNPTVTLLQKKRDGQIPGKRPEYLKGDDYGPAYKPDDKLYTIKREYESEDEEGSRRFAVLGPKKVHGVGPTTNDGVPTTLKSGVKSEHQGEWYRRMFDSLHKVKDARYGGYMSEPEGYDSDVGSSRYATLDRRRMHHFDADPMSSSLPRDYLADLDPFFRNTNRYVHQPGRIEDYVPGHSSLSEKEQKKNPEADIKVEAKSQEPPPVSVNHRLGSQKMSMTHALKESGYESDSTLVFRKREDARRQPPDPRKTSQVYRQIQRGGDIPLTGLQKSAPAKPKESPYKYESGEVNIHYRTPVRIEQKEAIPEEELARRQEEHMKKVYEQERRKKYLAELEDIERRRHTDNFTPLQKSPIPLNRYDDESSLGTLRGNRTPEPKQVAKALYNFTAQNKRELTFNKGDVIFIRRSIDKNWYEGELRGSVGIFPCNYVEIVPYDHMKTLTRKPTEGQARARFNFQAQTSMEMSLSKGELVVLTRRVDENWYEGRIGARKGIFPVSYVDTLVEPGPDRPLTPSSSPMPRPALPAANLLYNGASSYSSPYSTLGRPGSQNDSRPYNQSLTVNTQQEPVAYRALYNYKPQNDDELELLEGDVVLVMEKCDDGWFVGTSRRTGLFGTFPGNYVERI